MTAAALGLLVAQVVRLEVMGVLAAAGNGGEERGGRQRVG
jgi:hypothetical protein